jgi:hypothetical protein
MTGEARGMGLTDRITSPIGKGRTEVKGFAAGHYFATVNKNSLNMGTLTTALNDSWDKGWKLGHVFMQNNNTILIYERREDVAATAPPSD